MQYDTAPGFLAGGGEMGVLMRAQDWSATALGPPAGWPQSLKTASGILLSSSYPMYLAWGPEFIQIYNDAYRPILGSTKHPDALGDFAHRTFAEIWHFIGPMFERVMQTGEPGTHTDQILALDRHGYVEECYFTFSCSAVLREDGNVGGVFVTVLETTQRVLAERRQATGSGRPHWRSDGDFAGNFGSCVDIAERTQAEANLRDQKRILEMVAVGAPLADTLDALMLLMETRDAGVCCGIAVVTEDGRYFRRGRGPNLSETYHGILDGLPISPPYRGPCAEAAHLGVSVVVPDIANDTRYSDKWRKLLLSAGLGAVRSTPVRGSDGRVLASFAMYYGHACDPNPSDPQLIETATHLAAIALERDRHEAALRQANTRLATEGERLRRLFEQAPGFMCVLRGLEHVFELTNAAYLQLVGHRNLVGKPARDALPEVEGQGFFELLDNVYRTGEPFTGHAVPIRLQREPGYPADERFVDFIYQPITDGDAKVTGIFVEGYDVTDRVRGEAALRESEEFKRRVIESSRDCIKVLGLDGQLLWMSPGGQELLEISDFAALIGKSWVEFWPKEARAAARKAVDAAAGGGVHRFSAWCRTLAGTDKWMESILTPIVDAAGRPERILAVSRDMTDHRRAADRRALLVNELNHRVKNTLATVQALAMQTIRNTERSADFRGLFEARLAALSRAHDVLTLESWEGADLRDVVDRALEPFRSAKGRLTIEGPELRLTPKQALSLSMALHELATNAAKYGALSNDAGRIQIAWSIAPLDGTGELQLKWVEEGGPPVAPPKRSGFGSRLIERSLANDLGGDARIDFRPAGVVCSINSPLEFAGGPA